MPSAPPLTRKCITCREVKPCDAYASTKNRRCQECATPTPCVICGIPCDPSYKTCRSQECKAEAIQRWASQGGRTTHEKWMKRYGRRTAQTCAACRKHKPLGEEHWYKPHILPNGRLRYGPYCRECERVHQRLIYRMNPEYAARKRAYAAERRRRIKERAAQDPEFGAAYSAHRREIGQRHREKVRREREVVQVAEHRSGPELDARPFLEWLEKVAKRYATEGDCWVSLGVSERRVSDWRTGKAKSVRFDVVDEACLNEGNTDIGDIYEQYARDYEEELIAA